MKRSSRPRGGCVCAKSFQSCRTLCDPMDRSLPGSSVHRILQARILERAACPSPGDLPDLGIEPTSPPAPALQAYSLLLSHWGSPVPGEVRSKLPLISASPCVCVCCLFSHVQLFVTLWTLSHQVPLSTGSSRQEYWSGLPCPPPGNLLGLESNLGL